MYSRLELTKKYIKYYRTASNGKGHGVHSPFVYDFIIHILNDRSQYECYKKIEPLRKELLANNKEIEVEDFGAGSSVLPFRNRKVKSIATSSLKRKKFAQLLFRIARYYQSKTIVELGTSLGITTSYFACADKESSIYTMEGSKSIANIANENFKKNSLSNIQLITGNFDNTIPKLLDKLTTVDLLFIDGNHRKKPTLNYFEAFLKKATNESIFIFDDIHWSEEMEAAWKEIKQHKSVTLTIDLFFIGIVFFNTDFKEKQNFIIRF